MTGTGSAAVAHSWRDLEDRTTNAAMRWNKRFAERAMDGAAARGGAETPGNHAEMAFRVARSGQVVDSSAMVTIASDEGTLALDLGMQFHLDSPVEYEDTVLAEYGRNVIAPLLVSYLRAAVTTECQIMGWKPLILPASVDEVLRNRTDDEILGHHE